MTAHFLRFSLAATVALLLMSVSSLSFSAGLLLPPRNLKQGMNAAPPPPPAGDPCAGASAAPIKTIAPPGVAAARDAGPKGVNPYPGSGTALPIPDITDWQPHTRIAMGGELIVQGRNLKPGELIAMLGGDTLTPTTQSASEIRFRVPNETHGGTLVVFHRNGQPRTLETAYQVFDAMIAIRRVVPASFSTGDIVTVCGTNLFQVELLNSYKDGMNYQASPTKTGSFIEIGGKFFERSTATSLSIQVFEPTVSPSGDRMTFRVGKSFTGGVQEGGAGYLFPTVSSGNGFPTPAMANGTLLLPYKGGSMQNRVIGPTVTWSPGGPKVTAAYSKFGVAQRAAPWLIVPTPSTNSLGQQIVAEGANLAGAAWRIGSMAVSGASVNHENVPENGTYALIAVPANAVDGPVCATGNGKTSCAPSPVAIFGGPVITRVPPSPMPRLVNLTIEGLNLLPPPNAAGLTYRFDAAFLRADYQGPADSGHNVECNRVMQIIEHTANRIVFRIGNPAITTPPPARLPNGAPLFCDGTHPAGINISAWYQGQDMPLLKDLGLQYKQ